MPVLINDGPNPLERDPERPRSPVATLAAEVLLLALADLHGPTERDRVSAEQFFFADEEVSLLTFWCAVLECDAEAVRDGIRRQQREGRTLRRFGGRLRWIPTTEESLAATG